MVHIVYYNRCWCLKFTSTALIEVNYILKQLQGAVPTLLELPVGTQRYFRTCLFPLPKKRHCSNPCPIARETQLAQTKKLVSQKKNHAK